MKKFYLFILMGSFLFASVQVWAQQRVSGAKYYYRPIPRQDVTLNPNLTQIFGWE